MKKLFIETNSLDLKCYNKFCLTEDLLMEHAALTMANFIRDNFDRNKTILIIAGAGNNGADGVVLGRMLHGEYIVKVLLLDDPRTTVGLTQLERAKHVGVCFVKYFEPADIFVDAIFGSGLNKAVQGKYLEYIQMLNHCKGFKLSCDIPSGLGYCETPIKADVTICMGALKTILFEDFAKDFVGNIIVANLGVADELYEDASNMFLLEKSDLKLPFRLKLSSHKGNFGHLAIICGEKQGAAILSAKAGLNFGAGLVTVVSDNEILLDEDLIQNKTIPANCSALAFGMGLGSITKEKLDKLKGLKVAKILDADILCKDEVLYFLDDDVVITPHPKEFIALLKICDIAQINVEKLQENRFYYARIFAIKYPKVTLLLKGANMLIAKNGQIFVNSFGTPALSKGGSGDVLSGMIGALLAQGFSSLEAAINSSLAISLAAMNYDKNNYSMTPSELIKLIKEIK